MNENVNKGALFNGSCFALITTAFTFSIRAGILPQLGKAFGLSAEQLGFINSMWFFGFPISMIIGGLVYHTFGPKNIMMVAFVCHTIGIIMTIFAGGYTTLLISTLFIGIGNGCCNVSKENRIRLTHHAAYTDGTSYRCKTIEKPLHSYEAAQCINKAV